MIKTGSVGGNAGLLPDVFSLYVKERDVVADVTYGKGVFWQKIDKGKYTVLVSDILTGTDFRNLPYNDRSVDCLILDPPYMHGGKTIKESINDRYRNDNESHEAVIRLYTAGILEAARVLKKKGMIFVKCQDEIESGKQHLSHVELVTILEILGFLIVDLFVLVQASEPALQVREQKHARKNHSYLLIGRFRR